MKIIGEFLIKVLGMRYVTVKEIAEFLSVKQKTLYQWAELGQIPCYKPRGILRFDMDEVREWMKSCKRDVTSSYNPFTKLEARKGGKKQ